MRRWSRRGSTGHFFMLLLGVQQGHRLTGSAAVTVDGHTLATKLKGLPVDRIYIGGVGIVRKVDRLADR